MPAIRELGCGSIPLAGLDGFASGMDVFSAILILTVASRCGPSASDWINTKFGLPLFQLRRTGVQRAQSAQRKVETH